MRDQAHAITEPRYMKSSAGNFVAWSLHPPGHQYGQWSLVAVKEHTTHGNHRFAVTFERALSNAEIKHICTQPCHWWGEKLTNEMWALVKYVPSQFTPSTYVGSAPIHDPLRQVGV